MANKYFDTTNKYYRVISWPKQDSINYPWDTGFFAVSQNSTTYKLSPANFAIYLHITCHMNPPEIARQFRLAHRNPIVGKLPRIMKKYWGEGIGVNDLRGTLYSLPYDVPGCSAAAPPGMEPGFDRPDANGRPKLVPRSSPSAFKPNRKPPAVPSPPPTSGKTKTGAKPREALPPKPLPPAAPSRPILSRAMSASEIAELKASIGRGPNEPGRTARYRPLGKPDDKF